MEEFTSKSNILADMQAEWTALEQTLSRLSAAQMSTLGVTGQWSVKDILSHIVYWEKVLIDRMEGALKGSTLKYPPIMNNDDVDRCNNEVFLENRERALSDVQLEFITLYRELLTMLEGLDEAAYALPTPWDWTSEDLRLWHLIIANTSDHYKEHRLEIERFFH